MGKIFVYAYDGCWSMSLYSVVDTFRIVAILEERFGLQQKFSVLVVSEDGKPVRAAGNQAVHVSGGLLAAEPNDIIVVPAIEGPVLLDGVSLSQRVVEWLKGAASNGVRIVSLTTGAALIAAAGLSPGATLATHWAFIKTLQGQFPGYQFLSHPSFLRGTGIYTTGSMTGGFDALLELVGQHHGDRFAQICATHLLVGQPARLNPMLPGLRNHNDQTILAVQDWIESNCNVPLTIEQIASRAHLSERTLKRRFKAATSLPPIKYLQLVRIDKAKKVLLTTALSIDAVSRAVGYENPSFFVRIFKATVGTTPGRWREGTSPEVQDSGASVN